MLQSPDTVQACTVPTLLLLSGLVDTAFDVLKPAAKDLAIVPQHLTWTLLAVAIVVVRFAFSERFVAFLPLPRERGIAHTKQFCIARRSRQRYGHQLTNRKLMAFPQLEIPSK